MFYRLVVWGLRGFFRLFYRFHIEYVGENYPQGAIIAPNHASFLDPLVIAAACREEVHFLARSSLFRRTWWACVLEHLNAHPVNGSLQDLSSLRSVIESLRQGKKVVLFPEGGRTETGELQNVKMGVAMLALRAGVPMRSWRACSKLVSSALRKASRRGLSTKGEAAGRPSSLRKSRAISRKAASAAGTLPSWKWHERHSLTF